MSGKALKGSFLGLRSSKITLTSLTKEKERRKRKSDEEERGRSEKSNGCSFRFYHGYFVTLVLGRPKPKISEEDV